MGASLCEVIYQRNGVVGERIELGNREVPPCERANLIEEDDRRVPGILDGLNGPVITGDQLRWIKLEATRSLTQRTLNKTPFFVATDTAIIATIGAHRHIPHLSRRI